MPSNVIFDTPISGRGWHQTDQHAALLQPLRRRSHEGKLLIIFEMLHHHAGDNQVHFFRGRRRVRQKIVADGRQTMRGDLISKTLFKRRDGFCFKIV